MPITLNGTNGITTPIDVEIQGSTSGSILIAVPAVAGSNTQTLVATTGTLAPIVSGTAVASTSGTSIDFTGIPSWVKRITVMYSGVSTNGIAAFFIQIGTSSGIETTGYAGTAGYFGGTGGAYKATSFTTGFGVSPDSAASVLINGSAVITLLNGNTWTMMTTTGRTDNYLFTGGGAKTLAGALDRVRITTSNGTDAYDAGTINIFYE
jgi:hypothetical protein